MDSKFYAEPKEKLISLVDYEEARIVSLAVDGMGCPSCANRIRDSLIRLEGVLEVYVFPDFQLAEVIFNPENIEPRDFVHAIQSAGDDEQHNYQIRVILR